MGGMTSWQGWKTLCMGRDRHSAVWIHSTQVTTHSWGFQICGDPLEMRSWTMTQQYEPVFQAKGHLSLCVPGKASVRVLLPPVPLPQVSLLLHP